MSVYEKRCYCLEHSRKGSPFDINISTREHQSDGIIIEILCRPVMYYLITQLVIFEFATTMVEEALIECQTFVKNLLSVVNTKEIQPVSTYPIIHRTEIKGKLINLGLKRIVKLLDTSERHITQSNFEASLTSSRTAFEKMIDLQMKKRGLKQTNNYKNDVDRLRSKGYLDTETAKLLQSYYRCISMIGVHEKGETPAGIYEAQMGYGITLIILEYIINKLP